MFHPLYDAHNVVRIRDPSGGKQFSQRSLRRLAANWLRSHPEQFKPFLELSDNEDFESYCRKVEVTTKEEKNQW